MLKRLGVWGAWFALAILTFGPSIAGRNGSGTYSIPNVFVSGGTITASGQNQNFSDIATEITNSVAADGQTSMTGPLKAANGTAAAPSVTFASDTDTGFFRKSANTIGVSVAGVEVGYFDSNGLTLSSGATIPAGTVMPYAGSSAPSGYLIADGSCVSQITYATLYGVVGSTYGTCSAGQFALPDLTGRVVAGKEATATRLTSAVSGVDGGTLGAAGATQSKTLITANLPPYTPSGTVALNSTDFRGSFQADAQGACAGCSSPAPWGNAAGSPTPSATFSGTAQGGTSTPFSVVQPTIVLNYIIKT